MKYTLAQYDIVCSLTSLGIGLAAFRFKKIIPGFTGIYIHASLLGCALASLAFRSSRQLCRNEKRTNFLKKIDIILAKHAFLVCTLLLLPHRPPQFFAGLFLSMILLIQANRLEESTMSFKFHTLGHLALVFTLLFL